jgi:hypothetical protein
MTENGNLRAIFKASRLSSPHHGATIQVIVKGSEAVFYCKVPTKVVPFFFSFFELFDFARQWVSEDNM